MRSHRPVFVSVIVFVAVVATVIAFLMRNVVMSISHGPKVITAVLSGQIAFPLRPENISTIPLYQLHLNLWDTLVTSRGEPALARLVDVQNEGKRLQFEVREGSRFSNGRSIKSSDVVFSVERLMRKNPGGHFNASLVIEKVVALDDEKFEIFLKEPTPSFLFLLSIPEMGIVPREACDSDGNVQSLAVTSGAYRVEGSPSQDHVELVKNPLFDRHDPSSPDRIRLLFKLGAPAIERAVENEDTDFVEIYDNAGISAFPRLKENPDFYFKVTNPSLSAFVMTKSERLSRGQRMAVAKLINETFDRNYHPVLELEKRSFEMLPTGSFGSIELQAPLLEGPLSPADLPRRLKMAVGSPDVPVVQSIVKVFKDAGVEVELIGFSDSAGYDICLKGQGMNSDYPEIEFYLSMASPFASIQATTAEKDLIQRATHMSDRKERSEALQKIGRSLLEDGRVIPLFVRSYAHLYRKGKINVDHVTNYDGDVPFWKMRVE